MKQLTKVQSIFYHLYPGVAITLAFILLTPVLHYPPQFSLLLSIVLVAIPVMIGHLLWARKKENKRNIWALNEFTHKLSLMRLIGYAVGLVIFMYVIWGATQGLNILITEKLFSWLPAWYTVQDFHGYDKSAIRTTLALNLILNGLIAPVVEEFYFRGYLLPRMQTWGNGAFFVNTVLFSIYHFWQPYIYLTLMMALLPMIYLVWKTRDLRLAILTHVLLNLVGALLSFGLALRD